MKKAWVRKDWPWSKILDDDFLLIVLVEQARFDKHCKIYNISVNHKSYKKLFKDESRSRTGNLKHRFAWCLFMWALLEGKSLHFQLLYLPIIFTEHPI
jgi:hypothetical protein